MVSDSYFAARATNCAPGAYGRPKGAPRLAAVDKRRGAGFQRSLLRVDEAAALSARSPLGSRRAPGPKWFGGILGDCPRSAPGVALRWHNERRFIA